MPQYRYKWETIYSPGQKVLVKHYSVVVPAILIRKRGQPKNTWVGKKKIRDKWTKDVVIVERQIVSHE